MCDDVRRSFVSCDSVSFSPDGASLSPLVRGIIR